MNLIFRLVFHFIASLWRPTVPKNGIAITPMRVQLTDLDLLGHMNNGVYFSIMDIGRLDFMLRAKGLFPVLRRGMFPVMAAQTIRFYRSLNPFQKFSVHTELVAIDERHYYMKQSFYRKRNLHAVGYVQGVFLQRGRKGVVPPMEVMQVGKMNEWTLKDEPFVHEWKKQLALLKPRGSDRPLA